MIDELAGLLGIQEQVSAITEESMKGNIDFTESLKQRLALLKGLDLSNMSIVIEEDGREEYGIAHKEKSVTVVKGSFSMPAQSFISAEEEGKQENASGTVLRLRINPGVPELVAAAKRNGHHVAIISGGFGHFVKAVAVYLGISFSICNEAETEERDEDASSVGGIDARGNEANEAVESDKGIKIPFSCSGKEVRETGHSASAVNDRLILTGRLRNASINFNNKSNQHDYSFIVHGMQHHLPQIIERAGKAKVLLAVGWLCCSSLVNELVLAIESKLNILF